MPLNGYCDIFNMVDQSIQQRVSKLYRDFRLIAGLDEAGVGPLAGPVIAGAVILPVDFSHQSLNDSKKLSEKKRNELYDIITSAAIAWSVGRADILEIETLNIYHANLLAMSRAIHQLSISPECVMVDGKFQPKADCLVESFINGDALIPAIMAASIIAKVTRDREMQALDKDFPGYGFARHKGYATKEHLKALKRLGPCLIHRRTYAPVRILLAP